MVLWLLHFIFYHLHLLCIQSILGKKNYIRLNVYRFTQVRHLNRIVQVRYMVYAQLQINSVATNSVRTLTHTHKRCIWFPVTVADADAHANIRKLVFNGKRVFNVIIAGSYTKYFPCRYTRTHQNREFSSFKYHLVVQIKWIIFRNWMTIHCHS